MSPRLKLRAAATPLVMAGALWATGALGTAALGGGAQTPPPCGPDGVCVPRPETFGWYQTRWRSFPGDVAVKPPTPAAPEKQPEEGLGGPQLPRPTEEGQLGPAPTPREGAAPDEGGAEREGEAAGEDAAAAGLGTLPGEAPLPGFDLPGEGPPLPGAEGTPPATEGGEAPATGPQPGQEPEPARDPLDPFGSAPPTPPAWITSAASQRMPQQESRFNPLPVVEQAAVFGESEATAEPVQVKRPTAATAPATAPSPQTIQMPPAPANRSMEGSNLHGDDAPPKLPPALALGSHEAGKAIAETPVVTSDMEEPMVQKPVGVHAVVDDRVTTASAEQPAGIQLINPAAAMVDPNAEGLQQAIYFEASDQ